MLDHLPADLAAAVGVHDPVASEKRAFLPTALGGEAVAVGQPDPVAVAGPVVGPAACQQTAGAAGAGALCAFSEQRHHPAFMLMAVHDQGPFIPSLRLWMRAQRRRSGVLMGDRTQEAIRLELMLEAGRNPHDKALIELIGALSTQSEPFRRRWASHDVTFHRSGRKRLRHPVVGQLDLDFESPARCPRRPDSSSTSTPPPPGPRPPTLSGSWHPGPASQEQLATEAAAMPAG
ncbi:MmyB family transcriptional regulator [Geodermatophilus nigrescens]